MTTQAAPSFDLEYARVVKAAQTANDLAHHRYLVINACMEALARAGIANDAPLDHLVARLAGERDESERRVLALIADYARQSAQITALHAQIERERSARVSFFQTQLKETQRECARLLAIVGTETPIAAFDLVTTWRAEKAGYMDQVAELERECASWRGLAERRRDELARILEDAQACQAERRALCDILSADSSTIAGQTLVDASRALTRELATLRAAHAATIEKLTLDATTKE